VAVSGGDDVGAVMAQLFDRLAAWMGDNGVLAPSAYAPGMGVDEVTRKRVEQGAGDALREIGAPAGADADAIVSTVVSEALAVGPITPLVSDAGVSRITVNGPAHIFVTRDGQTERAPGRFSGGAAVVTAGARLLAAAGAHPEGGFGSGYLHDGTRIHVAMPGVGGPYLTIDRPSAAVGLEDLVASETLTANMATFLAAAMTQGKNIVVASNCADTRFGFIQALMGAAGDVRIVAVEGGARLQGGGNVVVLSGGDADNATLVRQALKMRPDRLVIGDARGPETFHALSALGGGVNGGVMGVDAESPDDALVRIVNQAGLGVSTTDDRVKALVMETADVLVQVLRYADGRVVVTQVLDVDGEMREVFNGLGGFRASGHVPRWVSNAQSLGAQIDASIFS